ncbi:MAG: carboxymuconolactone decarboxylase family protein, partial [Thermodesulfobacteriota bacterium]
MNHEEYEQFMGKFESLVPELHQPWTEYKEEVFKEGLISVKDKQLIAVSCAHITGCDHCIEERTKLAKAQGASDEEIAESVYIAVRLAMGQPYAFSSIALENYDLMTAKKNIAEGYFISKNITPQI